MQFIQELVEDPQLLPRVSDDRHGQQYALRIKVATKVPPSEVSPDERDEEARQSPDGA